MNNKRWNIELEDIRDEEAVKVHTRFDEAKSQMDNRTYHHELYGLLAKNKSIHEWSIKRGKTKYFSEGSTQYILRKVLADTIQRVPDGELITQYDKATKENIILQYLFENKIINSELEGVDMMSNLIKAFKMSFIYAFAPVRTGFEKDYDDDVRCVFSLEQWSDVFPNPDCTDIRRPDVVYFRQYMTKDSVLALIDEDGNVYDSTYNEDTVKYVIDNKLFGAKQSESEHLADRQKASTSIASLELITEYRRGADEFKTYVPSINAVFRTVPNYDPRKGIPWNFLVLEPDADFPIGVSQVEYLLADQQFNDLFQTSAYKNLLLAMEPPIMVSGWETNPSSYVYKPRKIWNLGNNPNNVKVEPVKIENSILTGWATTREAVAAAMVRNLNVSDGTIAKDAGAGYSKTAPGVEQATKEKTININQYQKRVETFFQDWAAQALRMYVNSMSGEHRIMVNENTRRRLFDIGAEDIIDGNKIVVDFTDLSVETMEFNVRTGSLIQRKEDEELDKLTVMIQPFIQNLNGWSEENRHTVENDVLLPVMARMVELSGTDISNTIYESLQSKIAKNMLANMQGQIDNQQMQLDGQQMQLDQMAQALPQPQEGQQMEQEMNTTGMLPAQQLPPQHQEQQMIEDETPDQQVDIMEDLLSI